MQDLWTINSIIISCVMKFPSEVAKLKRQEIAMEVAVDTTSTTGLLEESHEWIKTHRSGQTRSCAWTGG